MHRLTNPIRAYAWGSREVIGALQGRPVPSDGPEAELWIGAHPAAPSILDSPEGPVPLLDAITADPQRTVGPAAAAEFGPRLPYLLKVLAAQRPLSLQAHPDAEQALAGHAAGNVNYVDPFHKPELLVAVSEFVALCGFRDPKESADLLAALDVPALAPVVAALESSAPDGLGRAVRTLLTWPVEQRGPLVEAVASAGPVGSARPVGSAGALLPGQLAAEYPGDVGVVVALLLNHVTLLPGEAIWMPAGNLHTYLRGTGVEIMAGSDNVLRGGLTPKRVDVDELLRVLRFEVLAEPVVRPVAVAPGVVTWPTPAREFALYRVLLDEATPRVELALNGPREVLCLRGEVRVDDGLAPVTVPAGQAAFGPATDAPVSCAGAGELFLAALPRRG